jgi:acyl-CoA synthetase (AMP-forming)/AMP-acid ligase II
VSSPTVIAALAGALRSAPGRPLITMYDDSAGERVELSVATFGNWVYKLANLFGGDWGLEPGDLVSVQLPTHWRAAATTVGAWTAGLTVTFRSTPGAATSLLRWDDFAAEVPGQPDELVMPSPVTGPSLALADASGTSTHADLVRRGLAAADAVGLGQGGRLLTDLNPANEAGVDIALLAPLVTGASVVLILDATTERRERIAAQERVTCTCWA